MQNFFKQIKFRSGIVLAVSGGLTLIFLFLLAISMPTLKNVRCQGQDGSQNEISLPYRGNSKSGAFFIFRGILSKNLITETKVNIIPDDRVEWMNINGHAVNLSVVPSKQRGDWKHGFHINLRHYLHNGDNEVVIGIRNGGGKYGLAFFPSARSHMVYFLLGLIFLSFAVFLVGLSQKLLPWDHVLIGLLIGAVLLRVLVLFYTPYSLRTYDVQGHLDYIEYLLKHFFMPAKNAGWMFYHPPLYYYLAAIVARVVMLFTQDKQILYKILQFFSLILNIGFLISAVEIFREVFGSLGSRLGKRLEPVWIAVAIFLFWPGGVIHAVRIGNDSLQYLMASLSLLFFIKWQKGQGQREFYLAFLFGALGMLTKTNTILLFALLGIYYLVFLARTHNPLSRWKEVVVLGVLSLAVLIGGFRVSFSSFSPKSPQIVANANGLDKRLLVGNRAQNFLYFDLRTYINEPFVSPWDDKTGRNYFWNYLLKTSLFGEFSQEDKTLSNIAVVLSWLALLMVMYMLIGMVLQSRKRFFKNLVLWSYFGMLLIGAVIFRVIYPYSSSNDFRYILPILIPFSVFFSEALLFFRLQGWKRMEWTGYALAGSFILGSLWYFVQLGLASVRL